MKPKLFDLTDRVAIITGTSRGLGRALAKGFAESGAIVVGCSRNGAEAEAVAQDLRAAGHEAFAMRCDTAVRADVEALVAATVRRYGKLDIMLCNAGVDRPKPALEVTDADFDHIYEVNLRGYFVCAQEAARQMIRQGKGGAIVMNSSNASMVGFDKLAPYGASKGGTDVLVRTLASEWGPHGIRVNGFNPGYMNSRQAGSESMYTDDAFVQRTKDLTPLRRYGEAEELVGPAVFLASDAASFVTGVVLLVDGGWCAV
ncbi:MAG: glucose 1-dehydrogenase [Alphaproteobacteria bacterium]|nr:glucose 1-dehydrogenase [Alphaproteobacteria bacterium]